jgi:hypothetical protein
LNIARGKLLRVMLHRIVKLPLIHLFVGVELLKAQFIDAAAICATLQFVA